MDWFAVLLAAHSGVRWLLVVAAAVALVMMIYGLAAGRAYSRSSSLPLTIFVRLTELQWVLGLVAILAYAAQTSGAVQHYHWAHLVLMTIAVVTAHLYMGFRRRDDRARHLGGLLAIVVTVIVVIVGVAVLPGNRWDFSTRAEASAITAQAVTPPAG